jgi:hypothetical protein
LSRFLNPGWPRLCPGSLGRRLDSLATSLSVLARQQADLTLVHVAEKPVAMKQRMYFVQGRSPISPHHPRQCERGQGKGPAP